jgi:Concanavalin A-like lectin/glucanases superfamily
MKKIGFFAIIGCISMLSCKKQKEEPDVLDGRTAYVSFNNGNFTNQVGSGNSPMFIFGASPTIDRFNNQKSAANFDGQSYMVLKNVNVSSNEFTFSWWASFDAVPNPNNLFFFFDIKSTNYLFPNVFGSAMNNSYFSNTGWSIAGGNTDGTNVSAVSGVLPSVGTWYHYVAVRDNQELRGYIDGKLVMSKPVNSKLPYVEKNGAEVFWGCRSNGNSFLKGKLDEIRIYSRALTNEEIQTLYNRN